VIAGDADGDSIADIKRVTKAIKDSAKLPPIPPATMLIDRTHGQWFDVSGFTDYLVSQGWTVDEVTTGPITSATLSGYDVFMIPCRMDTNFTPSEANAVADYVNGGAGVWIFGEYKGLDDVLPNVVAAPFGIEFNEDMVYDPTDNEGYDFWPIIHLLEPHPITEGVSSFGYYAGCSLDVAPPSIVIGKGDDDAYSDFYPAGYYPPVLAIANYGAGRVVAIGDNTPLHPSYYPDELREEERLLLSNIAVWLSQKEPQGPNIEVILNGEVFTGSDTLTVDVHVTNGPEPVKVDIIIWISLPTGEIIRIVDIPGFTLPANIDKIVRIFEHHFSCNEPFGLYAVGALLIFHPGEVIFDVKLFEKILYPPSTK
jgi:hypothetical protein